MTVLPHYLSLIGLKINYKNVYRKADPIDLFVLIWPNSSE